MSSSPTPIGAKHQILLGRPATEKQIRLYEKFPDFRGFSDSSLDPEVAEAILVSALLYGTVQNRVYIFAPPIHEAWVMERFNDAAERIFDNCRQYKNAARVAEGYGMLFKKVAFMGRVLQMPEEPSHWLALGFSATDPVPEWVKARLIA